MRTPKHAAKDTLTLPETGGKSRERLLAEVCLEPVAGAAANLRLFNAGHFGLQTITDTYDALQANVEASRAEGDAQARDMLFCQAAGLNSIFTELARRSALNMGEYIGAADTYMRLALKAQAQCRATIEAIERLDRGGVQTVKHVHLDNRGGQAIVAESLQIGGAQIGKVDEQPHAINHARPLQCTNPERDALPVARDG